MKLEVPDPDADDAAEPPEMAFGLWLGMALSVAIVGLGWLLAIQPRLGEPPSDQTTIDTDQTTRHDVDPALDGLDFDDLDEPEARLVRHVEDGDRDRAEQQCQKLEQSLREGTVSRQTRRILRQGVSRQAGAIPWTCLTGLVVRDQLPDNDELTRQLEEFWQEVDSLEDHGEIMVSILADRTDDGLFDAAPFDDWLRRCALAVDYPAAPTCRQLVRRHRPEWGEDILEVLLTELSREPMAPRRYYDEHGDRLQSATDALTHFARYGQPAGWVVDQTAEIDDYNRAFRRGATFQLCRMMNSPDRDIQIRVGDALGDVAGIASRPLDPNMQFRWRQTCRMLFGDPERPDASVPVLGVSMVDGDEQLVDYGLDTLVDRGLCDQSDDRPAWYCGARRWHGDDRTDDRADDPSVSRLIGHYFARTGYVEWYEPDDVDELAPRHRPDSRD